MRPTTPIRRALNADGLAASLRSSSASSSQDEEFEKGAWKCNEIKDSDDTITGLTKQALGLVGLEGSPPDTLGGLEARRSIYRRYAAILRL